MTWPEAVATSVGALASAAVLIALIYFFFKDN